MESLGTSLLTSAAANLGTVQFRRGLIVRVWSHTLDVFGRRLMPPNRDAVKPRASACAKASLQAEIERVRRMTVEERVLAALSMKSRFGWLQPAPTGKREHESS